jgi:hypothetical protein
VVTCPPNITTTTTITTIRVLNRNTFGQIPNRNHRDAVVVNPLPTHPWPTGRPISIITLDIPIEATTKEALRSQPTAVAYFAENIPYQRSKTLISSTNIHESFSRLHSPSSTSSTGVSTYSFKKNEQI